MTISDVLDDLFAKASSCLDDILELEGVPFTQNQHYFVSTRDEVLADLRKARQTAGPGTAGGEVDQEMLSEALSALAAIGYQGLKEEDLPKLLPGDVYEEELEAAAQTVAYWKVHRLFVASSGFTTDHVVSQVAYKVGEREVIFLAVDADTVSHAAHRRRRPAHHRLFHHPPAPLGHLARTPRAPRRGRRQRDPPAHVRVAGSCGGEGRVEHAQEAARGGQEGVARVWEDGLEGSRFLGNHHLGW